MTKNQADQVCACTLLEQIREDLLQISKLKCWDIKTETYIADMALGVKHLQDAVAPPIRTITILKGYPNVSSEEG